MHHRQDYEGMDPVDRHAKKVDQSADWSWIIIVILTVMLLGGSIFFFAKPREIDAADIPAWQVDGQETNTTSARPSYDPYHAESYRDFLNKLSGGYGPGILYVGVPDGSVGTYEFHYAVEAGFGGLARGVYDCGYDEETGQAKMQLRPAPVVAVQGVTAQSPFQQTPTDARSVVNYPQGIVVGSGSPLQGTHGASTHTNVLMDIGGLTTLLNCPPTG